MKEIKNYILITLIVILAISLYKIILIIIGFALFLLLISVIVASTTYNLKIKRFKRKNEGKYFLWYSSNKRIKNEIALYLIPLISFNYEIIYNNKNNVESCLTKDELNYITSTTSGKKFPVLYKITKNGIYSESFYYETIHYKKARLNKAEFEKKVCFKLNKIKNQ